jgi:ankyrin repeat protein
MYASKRGNVEIAKILLEKGADFNMKSDASILS